MKFRFKALQKMREPDELDSPTLLASPRGWIATFVVLIITVGAGAWVFTGRLPVTIGAAGLLTHRYGTTELQSSYQGTVKTVKVKPGDKVKRGQPVAVIEPPGDQTGQTDQTDQTGIVDEETGLVGQGVEETSERRVLSPYSGQVVGISVTAGHHVNAGEPMMTVDQIKGGDDRLVAMLFLPADKGSGVAPGRSVDLAVSSAPPGAFGLLRGRVRSSSSYPLTEEAISSLVGGRLTARGFAAGGPQRLVTVDLIPDPSTKSGYAWSAKAGPPLRLQSQTKVSGTINLSSQKPFDVLLGR